MRAVVALALSALLVAEPALAGSRAPRPSTSDTRVTVELVKPPAPGLELADDGPPPALRPITPGALMQARRVVSHSLKAADLERMMDRMLGDDGMGGKPPPAVRETMMRGIRVIAAHEAELDEAFSRALAESYDETTLAQLAEFLETPEGRALTAKLPDMLPVMMARMRPAMPGVAASSTAPLPAADPANVRLAHSLLTAVAGPPTFTYPVNGKLMTFTYPLSRADLKKLDPQGRRMARDMGRNIPPMMRGVEEALALVYTPGELMAFLGFALSPTVADLKAGAPTFKFAVAQEMGPLMMKIQPELERAMQPPDGQP